MQRKSNSIECKLVHDHVLDYVENQLPQDIQEVIEEHRAGCEDCNNLIAHFRGILNTLENEKMAEPEPFAETRILQAVENSIDGRKERPINVYDRFLKPSFIGLSIITAITVGIIIGTGSAYQQARHDHDKVMTDDIRSDLNMPEYAVDEPVTFTE